MTANMFFSQTIMHSQSSGLNHARLGSSRQDRPAAVGRSDKAPFDNPDSFLNTLKRISRDKNTNSQSADADRGKSSDIRSNDSVNKFNENSNSAADPETGISDKPIQSENAPDNEDIEKTNEPNFLAVIKMLEELGYLDSAGGASSPVKSDGIPNDIEDPHALKMLMAAKSGQRDSVPLNEINNVLDQLRQLIANTQKNTTSSTNAENSPVNPAGGRAAAEADLDQMLKGIAPDQADRPSAPVSGDTGKNDSIENQAETAAKIARMVVEAADQSRPAGSADSVGKSENPSQAENGAKSDGLKLTAEVRGDGVETIEKNNAQTTATKDRVPNFSAQNGSDDPLKIKTESREGFFNRTTAVTMSGGRLDDEAVQDKLPHNGSRTTLKMADDAQSVKGLNHGMRYANEYTPESKTNDDFTAASKAAGDGQSAKASMHGFQYTGETSQGNLANNESSPVVKMINDALLAKENQIKLDAAPLDDAALKIAKIDTGSNDAGLLNSQHQTTEKTLEGTGFSRQTEAGHNSLQTQTLDQIVKKAVIHVRAGQHEARIDLKPEFLGHVRMQVTTENHQVTVRILTEFPMVKDMIENNIQQLKTDLQQQGLNVDKLEVSVSHDADKNEDFRHEAGRAKGRSQKADQPNPENLESETPKPNGNSGLRTAGAGRVDYFA